VIPEERPSLIHGDLWNGNYLIAKEGKPVLIDPAVSYGIREMDLAMMHLFGGFSEEVYNVYHELSPLQAGWQDRTSLWQLYYLLVHLNLFGSGYLSQVQTAIKRYL
jgi:fructosamine-3-kinase